MGNHGGATALWFDGDNERWRIRPSALVQGKMRLSVLAKGDTEHIVAAASSIPAVIARMLIASVLHYTYTPHQLPPREQMDISVDLSVTDFSQAWKELQELFRKQLDWYRKAFRNPNLYSRKSGR